MLDEVVVWNLDVRNRPELEVEIEVVGRHKPTTTPAKGTPPLGTSALLKDADIPFANLDELLSDAWFCDVDAYVADDGSVVLS
ncbi:MAG TPA: hypothetical protein VGM39_16350 [Kofleriaceae bacterium]|jgi:hypothetical protein